MITKYQAEAIVRATSYRDWSVEPMDYASLTVAQIMGSVKVELNHAVPVVFTYRAPNSTEGLAEVTNSIALAIPLTDTEEQFARALYEGISIIEEHERREFFRIDYSVIRNRPRERATGQLDARGWVTGGGSPALFHPHGVNRNNLFHDLDPFAKDLTLKTLDGSTMSADAA